nr:vegetative cell wall protein gp1-like [Lolium perenne]
MPAPNQRPGSRRPTISSTGKARPSPPGHGTHRPARTSGAYHLRSAADSKPGARAPSAAASLWSAVPTSLAVGDAPLPRMQAPCPFRAKPPAPAIQPPQCHASSDGPLPTSPPPATWPPAPAHPSPPFSLSATLFMSIFLAVQLSKNRQRKFVHGEVQTQASGGHPFPLAA